MKFTELLDKLIDELNTKLEGNREEEKALIEQKIHVLDECKNALESDEVLLQYNFSEVIELLREEGIEAGDIVSYLEEVKQVINMRNTLNLPDYPMSDQQTVSLGLLREYLDTASSTLKEKGENLEIVSNEATNLEDLRDLLNGKGKKKYYTNDMIESLASNIDLLNISDEEFDSMITAFFETKNFKVRQGLNKENIEDVIALYKEFLDSKEFIEKPKSEEEGLFLKLLTSKDYINEVLWNIDLYNAREILDFFKEKGIIKNFERKALLGITLYGDIKKVRKVYESSLDENGEVYPGYYTTILSSNWTNINERRFRPFLVRQSKGGKEGPKGAKSLLTQMGNGDNESFLHIVELLQKNSDLFLEGDSFTLINLGAHLVAMKSFDDLDRPDQRLLTLIKKSPWALVKNISLFNIFRLGQLLEYRLPLACLEKGDLENKIHLAIELGLLNPPLDKIYRQLDKDSGLNKSFMSIKTHNNISENTIRNYFTRNMSILASMDNKQYGFLMQRLYEMGPVEFYEYFFNENLSGKRAQDRLEEDMVDFNDDKDAFIEENFFTPTGRIKVYMDEIDAYNAKLKEDFEDKDYYDESILEEDLIRILEDNFIVKNLLDSGEEAKEDKPFLYKINMGEFLHDRLISRFRVLRNASILKRIHGFFNEDMLMASICKHSYVKKEEYDYFENLIKERGLNL